MRQIPVLLVMAFTISCGSRADVVSPSPAPARTTAAATPSADPKATPFDTEAWRNDAIEKFGPEREFSDGTKIDYVEVADKVCALEKPPDYKPGSIQTFILTTYCPNV